jgi:hypothetical protein
MPLRVKYSMQYIRVNKVGIMGIKRGKNINLQYLWDKMHLKWYLKNQTCFSSFFCPKIWALKAVTIDTFSLHLASMKKSLSWGIWSEETQRAFNQIDHFLPLSPGTFYTELAKSFLHRAGKKLWLQLREFWDKTRNLLPRISPIWSQNTVL